MMQHLRVVRSFRLGVKNLMLHPLRSLLTMLGLLFGVGSVIAMLAVGEGASEEALEQIRKLGSRNIILDSVKPAQEEQDTTQQQRVNIYGLLYDDERRINESYPSVVRTVPVKTIRKDGRLGERQKELRIVGTTPDWFRLVRRPLIVGRVITWQDSEEHSAVCLLTEKGARTLLATEHTVGEPIRVGSEVYEVIGIVRSEEGSAGSQTPDLDEDAYIPLSTVRERYGDQDMQRSAGSFQREQVELHHILVEVDRDTRVERTASAIERMLEIFHKKKDYRVRVPLALLKQTEATKRTFNIVLGSIAGISLLVGGIGIMNIMLASVTERTREIGIRRAIGAKQAQIISQFLVETVVLSSVGGLIGIGFGMAVPSVIEYYAGMRTIITGWSILLSLGISVSVGIVFGLYPAYRASRLDPIVALRHE
ncbi:MAG TPA: ABC transporter permease [Planctomycetota bacterium]|nr:ABC transporter permease [Planctomycetota bacterium]